MFIIKYKRYGSCLDIDYANLWPFYADAEYLTFELPIDNILCEFNSCENDLSIKALSSERMF